MDVQAEFLKADRYLAAMEKATKRELIRVYARSSREVQAILADFARRYEKNGKLSYAEAAKYNRLVALESQINTELRKLGIRATNITRRDLGDLFGESYYRTGYIIDTAGRQMGAATSWSLLNPRVIEAAIQMPISGLTLNERLALRRSEIIWRVKQEITQGLIRGEGYAPIARRLRQTFEGDAVKSLRVVQTEAHRVQNEGRWLAGDRGREQGIEMQKKWRATLDDRTRDTHATMDGQVVGMDDDFTSPSGATAPYPGAFGVAAEDINCRCGFLYVIEGLAPTVRRVRGEGIVEYQTYSEWRDAKLPKAAD